LLNSVGKLLLQLRGTLAVRAWGDCAGGQNETAPHCVFSSQSHLQQKMATDLASKAGCHIFHKREDHCIDDSSTAFMILATTFVYLQTPAMGICQAGMVRRKNSLSMLMQTLVCVLRALLPSSDMPPLCCRLLLIRCPQTGLIIGSMMWYFVGFGLVFGYPSIGGYIGNPFDHFMFLSFPWDSCFCGQSIPAPLFATFQMMFALMTPVILTGAWAEKLTFQAFIVVMIAWPLLIYYPVAHWIWGSSTGSNGWLSTLGVMDFAGGIVIHATSGVAALTISMMLEKRKGDRASCARCCCFASDYHLQGWNISLTPTTTCPSPSSVASSSGAAGTSSTVVLRCPPTSRPPTRCSIPTLPPARCACLHPPCMLMLPHSLLRQGGLVWVTLSYFRDNQFHLLDILNGALAGLAGITPCSGFVSSQSACFIGSFVGVVSYHAVPFFKNTLKIDDVLDVTSLQAVPGIMGSLMVGLFATSSAQPTPCVGCDGVFYSSSGWRLLFVQVSAPLHASIWLLFVCVRVCAWHVTSVYQALAVIVCSVWSAFWTWFLFRAMEKAGIQIQARAPQPLKP